uniref:DUF3741 domain-containing protein n=1 Tax=Aegilops tauschii TaxID=37682 RepID=M8BJQ7_AEGTA
MALLLLLAYAALAVAALSHRSALHALRRLWRWADDQTQAYQLHQVPRRLPGAEGVHRENPLFLKAAAYPSSSSSPTPRSPWRRSRTGPRPPPAAPRPRRGGAGAELHGRRGLVLRRGAGDGVHHAGRRALARGGGRAGAAGRARPVHALRLRGLQGAGRQLPRADRPQAVPAGGGRGSQAAGERRPSPAELGEIMLANRASSSRALRTVITRLQHERASEGSAAPTPAPPRMPHRRITSWSGAGQWDGGAEEDAGTTACAGGGVLGKDAAPMRELKKLYGLIKTRSRKDGPGVAPSEEGEATAAVSGRWSGSGSNHGMER